MLFQMIDDVAELIVDVTRKSAVGAVLVGTKRPRKYRIEFLSNTHILILELVDTIFDINLSCSTDRIP